MKSPKRKWLLTIFILVVPRPVNVQYVFPMPPLPPQPMPPPLAPPMAMGGPFYGMRPMPPAPMFGIAPPHPMNVVLPSFSVQIAESTGGQNEYKIVYPTTTTTPAPHSDSGSVAIAVPMPLPVQIGVPAIQPPAFCQARPSPPGCPPCPPCMCFPSCTPSFFSYCSGCHQKCRCRNGENFPVPIPPQIPVPVPGPAYPVGLPPVGPPNVMVLPYPHRIHRRRRIKKTRYESSSSSSEDSSSSSSSSDCQDSSCYQNNRYSFIASKIRRTKHHHKNRNNEIGFSRRSTGANKIKIKPVLSYVSDSDVETVRREGFGGGDGFELVQDPPKVQRVSVTATNRKRPKITVTSERFDNSVVENGYRSRKYVLRSKDDSHHTLLEGKKELVFTPPENKKISNLSVVFQVS